MTPRKAQASSGKLRHTRAQEPSPSFTRRRIPQEPVRFNGALARLSFSVVLMSSMTSTLGERLTAHVVRLAPAAFRFHAHLGRPPLSTLGSAHPARSPLPAFRFHAHQCKPPVLDAPPLLLAKTKGFASPQNPHQLPSRRQPLRRACRRSSLHDSDQQCRSH